LFEAIGVAFLVAVEVLRDPGRRIAPWIPIDLGRDPWGNALNAAAFAMILIQLGGSFAFSPVHEKRPTSFRSGGVADDIQPEGQFDSSLLFAVCAIYFARDMQPGNF
jgi:hypothetical protein